MMFRMNGGACRIRLGLMGLASVFSHGVLYTFHQQLSNICAMNVFMVIGYSSQNDGITPSSPKVSGNVLSTVTYRPVNGGRFDPQGVRIEGRMFAGQHSRTPVKWM